MKKLFTLFLLCSSMQLFGQLTFVRETNQGKDLASFMLSDGKWIKYDNEVKYNVNHDSEESKLQSITFYNTDYSVYKVLNILQQFPYDTIGFKNSIQLYTIRQNGGIINDYEFTDNFFNLDSKIELVVSYKSVKNDNYQIRKSSILILNEDGMIIKQFDNPDGSLYIDYWKYFDIIYNFNSGTQVTKSYSVPGALPCPFTCGQKSAAIAPISPANEFKEIQLNGFPNPSSDKVTLAYTLPEGVSFGTLRLYTQTGELVKEFKVSSQVDHLELPVSDYTPGTYYYELQAGGNTSGGKKMVVIH